MKSKLKLKLKLIFTGFKFFIVRKVKVIAIPVANGRTSKFFIKFIPIEFNKFWVSEHVSCTRREDPTAFGWSSLTSPDLKIIK